MANGASEEFEGSVVLKRCFIFMVLAGLWFSLFPLVGIAKNCVGEGRSSAECIIEEPVPGSGGSGVGGSGGSGSRRCFRGGVEVACESEYGSWNDGEQWWCKRVVDPPPRSDPAWQGRSGGRLELCTSGRRPGAGGYVSMWVWRPDGVVDPEVVARRLFARIRFEAIDMGLFPYGDDPPMVVKLPVWMWVDEPSREQWGPVSVSVSEGGVSVSLTARVRHVVWDMGNGDRVTCGLGSVFPEGWSVSVGGPWSGSCGYVYRRDGCYVVRALSVWDVYWSGGGRSGVIPLRLEASKRVKVVELRTYVAVPGYARTRKPSPISCDN